jgi:anthranilate synthase/aminodeoxychorismate synthase-like glutamine amidotransferase
MKVLLVDNHDSFTFNLAQLIEQCGITGLKIVKVSHLNLDEAESFRKIIISPGPGLPKDYPDLFRLLKLYSGSKSILGVCLGHQAIAEFYGARLMNLNSVFHGVPKKVRILREDYLFRNVPDGFEAGLYHSWAVSDENLPSEIAVTSRADDGIIMSISHVLLDIKGVQFHPESIMTKTGIHLMRNWLEHEQSA